MVYASKEQYLSEHNTIPEEQIEKILKQASRHIDSLTFNRITSRGFDNLTEFQQAIIIDVCCDMADFEYENEDMINCVLQNYAVRRLTTGKSLGMTMGGKRNYGDEGNDYIASLALKTGQECNTWVSIIFPNLDQLLIPAVINVTSLGGDSTSIDALEWEAQSDGKPTYIPYTE